MRFLAGKFAALLPVADGDQERHRSREEYKGEEARLHNIDGSCTTSEVSSICQKS